ncbi:MAG: hypothetical protein NTX40_09860 [Planctomycetota bacterium]|nr:hypothetical protein [Planctomycetota bacterium]
MARLSIRILPALVGLGMVLAGCSGPEPPPAAENPATGEHFTSPAPPAPKPPAPLRDYKAVAVFVALCDNAHQGIVKVPAALGNGQDPANNLYWGAAYGVKTFFSKSPHWAATPCIARFEHDAVLETCGFASRGPGPTVYVAFHAYDGARMKEALTDFLEDAAGKSGGLVDLVCFVGHNGLMDMQLESYPSPMGERHPAAVVLACKSRDYFLEPLRKAGAQPIVTTTGFMAPEAYTLDAIIRSWAAGDPAETVCRNAAAAYAEYQKCGVRAAERLFAAGS